jgi:hypothetical protein
LYERYRDEEEVEIDIETVPSNPEIKYDSAKAQSLMKECEKHVNFARTTDVPENWEAQIVKYVKNQSQDQCDIVIAIPLQE